MKLALLAALAAALVMTTAAATTPSPEGGSASEVASTGGPVRQLAVRTARCVRATPRLKRAIVERRSATWRHQDSIEIPRTPTAFRERTVIGCGYLRWSKRRWSERADAVWRRVVELRDPDEAICHVFGIYCSEALDVAACESGDRDGDLSEEALWATNGQYLGMFQMGSSERARYGHGTTALAQARAAYRYFVASGRDWSPWQCRPGGRLAW